MFILGHLGVGERCVRWVRPALPLAWVFLGTLLPDLIDKTLYWVLASATGLHGIELGIISGSRTVGHSLVFLGLVTWFGIQGRYRVKVIGVTWGVLSHLVLDMVQDLFQGSGFLENGAVVAVFFPLLGFRFPVLHALNVGDHLRGMANLPVLGFEILGSILLWKARQRIAGLFRNFSKKSGSGTI